MVCDIGLIGSFAIFCYLA